MPGICIGIGLWCTISPSMSRTDHSTDMMGLPHVGGLIALLLVASTLPASAWEPVAADPERDSSPAAPEAPSSETTKPESSQDKDDTGDAAQLRPQADVWQPAGVRAVSTKAAPSFLESDSPTAPVAHTPGRYHASTLENDQSLPSLARRAWLACRYPHAPPRTS